MLTAAILAAGQSLRMRRPKAFLPVEPGKGPTFLEAILTALGQSGVAARLVVGRPDDEALRRATQAAGGRFVPNPDHRRGQLTSILAAVAEAERAGAGGLLVIPVDMPFVRPATFAAVVRAAEEHPGWIVRACCAGRHGHPVVFDAGSFGALRRADPAVGAKPLMRAASARVLNLETGDEGVLKDVDSVEDYVAAFGVAPPAAESP